MTAFPSGFLLYIPMGFEHIRLLPPSIAPLFSFPPPPLELPDPLTGSILCSCLFALPLKVKPFGLFWNLILWRGLLPPSLKTHHPPRSQPVFPCSSLDAASSCFLATMLQLSPPDAIVALGKWPVSFPFSPLLISPPFC